jgi:hypothetical protein
MTPRLLRTALVAATLAVCAVPSVASAANSLEIGIADENVLNGSTPGGTDATVAQWKASGVQDVRIFAQWGKMVPQDSANNAKAPSGFKPDDPASYDFANLNAKIDAVVKHGLNVTLVVTGPGPVWGSSEPARRNGAWKPDPAQFAKFAAAVAKDVGPKVARYIVWNEPNLGYWLQPQYSCVAKKSSITGFSCTSVAPHLYRDLARAGYDAIHANDPDARVAVGATSSYGTKFPDRANATTSPLTFLRTMSCVNTKYRSVRSGDCKGFKPVTGDALAYHPHSGKAYSPGKADTDTNNARMADLPRLIKAIDKLTTRKRLKVSGAKRLPLWLDEYGYQTNPPDEQDGIAPDKAASYLQWGWSLAARNPRVETLTQYEWFDESLGEDKNGEATFNRWQSGLFTHDGKAKPLAAVFANPIFGWYTKSTGYVWGQVRPGDAATTVRLQQGGKAASSFKDYKTVTTDKYGIFQVKVPKSTTTRYRFVYTDPNTQAEVTSAAAPLIDPVEKAKKK